ncbi:hypothetical protein CRENBAI_021564 [Crenichthys baileyi]|uniref:A-kinase anchor protein 11 n=1 Tax=Crenichthys baileyi TaxID=28760 RepID=A0AAV9R2R3_9TELE
MDAGVRVKGVPTRSRPSVRRETVRDSGAQSAKSLFRNKKELCSVGLELPTRDTPRLTEIHFVCLPGQCEGNEFTQQALSSLPGKLCELLRSLHAHSLRNDEVLLLKDSCRLAEHRDVGPQCWLKAVCVLRQNPCTGTHPQASVASLVGFLGCYVAGVRYVLELQSLQRGLSEPSQPEEDDTNQSVSSIEDDFVTALEHLEEEDTRDNPSAAVFGHFKKRDVASQTVPAHKRKKELSGSRVIISSSSKKHSAKHGSAPDVSVTVQRLSSGVESQWTYCSPGARPPSPSAHISESEESDCSSPSPIIFLDEVGYQKSLLAKLDIPQVPGGPRERVEDSDSEVSEFFDSFDQFDDLEELSSESCTLTLPLDSIIASAAQKKSDTGPISTYVSRGCSTKNMNPQRFDQPTLPANVKKPTPLKPGSPYSVHPDMPDSPWLAQTPSEENGGPLFSPVCSAFSPLVDSSGPLEYFWKTEEKAEDKSELRKPQDLCSLYKTYSDFANNLSKEILGSVCGFQSAVDISDNKNLSCVCHKEFKNPSGYLMKLSDIQETVTVAKLQKKSQSLKDGIQRFASDLVEMSLGSALRDLQKGVSSCTTTLCHLAARLTSSVFQMAFHEIGMRRASVLKERAINGLAGFLVGEAISGALKEFLTVKKQIFHNTVTQFAADLAEELVFEGIMEVCQFSLPSTPITPSDWAFGHGQVEEEEEEEVVTSYALDLSESVIQEAFIELSQADVAFTSQAAISVSLDNICYVNAENTTTHTSSIFANKQVLSASSTSAAPGASEEEASCTVKNALFTVSGMASCIPVPHAGQALSSFQDLEEASQYKSSMSGSPKTSTTELTVTSTDSISSKHTHAYHHEAHTSMPVGGSSQQRLFQNFSGNMVDMIVTEACELITASKMKKSFGDCADFLTKTIGSRRNSSSKQETPDSPLKHGADSEHFRYDKCVRQGAPAECVPPVSFPAGSSNQGKVQFEMDPRRRDVDQTHPLMMDSLDVPSSALVGRGWISARVEDPAPGSGQTSAGTPGTPPSSPQQPSEVSKEKQIKQFSKKLKSKLANEFSPATPPPTPHYQPEPGPGPEDVIPDADKAEFMLSLMRSLSEEAVGDEDVEEEEPVDEEGVSGTKRGVEADCRRRDVSQVSSRRMFNKEALHYAERLACHIVSMATEMDTLGVSEEEGELSKSSERRRDSVAQFSEQTLNMLWVYAGEVAGLVINDVKTMVSSGQQCPYHRAQDLRRRSFGRSSSEGWRPRYQHQSQPSTDQNRSSRLAKLAEQWSNDLIASVSQSPPSTSSSISSSSSGLSSEYPSCESVTDEYAGYLIKVLKKEGGSRELVLDQYASRLAYRSIKLGLAHASRKNKQRSNSSRLLSSKSLPDEWKASGCETLSSKDRSESVGLVSGQDPQCCCRVSDKQSKREYMDLVNFAESLAYNITCDVTHKLHLSSVRLPKSLTDSCLYKKSKLEDMADDIIRNSFSCPLLSKEDKTRHCHSTGSLYDKGYSCRVMQVIEHYARKIVDDTVKMSLASVGHSSWEHLRSHGHDRHSHTQRLSEGPAEVQSLGERTCRYCLSQECPHCTKPNRHHYQPVLQTRIRALESYSASERLSSVEIPRIHIDLDNRAAFAEEVVSLAMETAKRELSNTSLNADSGIGHDGTSYAESLTAEIMTSALSNICQAANISSPGREPTESTVSQQLSVGEDSLGSWSNLSFEDDHPDDNSSFLHLSDSNGNSSSWSSLGLEGEVCEERLSFSPSDSDNTEDKETKVKEESSGTLCADRTQAQTPRTALFIVNSDFRELGRGFQHTTLDPQLRSMLQWAAASVVDIPQIQLSVDSELQQLPAVVQKLQERKWKVADLLHMLLRYQEESLCHPPPGVTVAARETQCTPLFQWLLEHA